MACVQLWRCLELPMAPLVAKLCTILASLDRQVENFQAAFLYSSYAARLSYCIAVPKCSGVQLKRVVHSLLHSCQTAPLLNCSSRVA
jgi:hypothetical protein